MAAGLWFDVTHYFYIYMIVESMTHEEVYDEIDRDLDNLGEWWMRKRDVLASMARRRPNFPMVNWIEWESPRRIRYLIWSKVYGRNYNNQAATMFLVMRHVRNGIEVYVTRLPWQMIANRIIVLPHVFDRYSDPKRGNVRKQGVELIKHFFEHNGIGEPTRNQELAGRSVRYNGELHVCDCCKDGVLLGKEIADGSIFVARTFITYDMATGLQKEEFGEKRSQVMSTAESMMMIKKLYGK